MQRAAASTPPTTPQVQTHPQSQSTEPTPSKRQKTSDSPRPMAASTSNAQLIQPTLDEEECRREKAIEKLAEDAGETKWVLNTAEESLKKIKPNISVTSAGYSEIDDSTSSPAMSGRMSFGNFNRALEVGFPLAFSLLFIGRSAHQPLQANRSCAWFRGTQMVGYTDHHRRTSKGLKPVMIKLEIAETTITIALIKMLQHL